MPAYITTPQPVQLVALYKGNSIFFVNNAAVDSGITKTVQAAVGPEPGAGGVTLNIINETNEQATLETAWADADANYQPVSGGIIAAGASLEYNLSGGWIRFTFGTAPTTGSLVVTR